MFASNGSNFLVDILAQHLRTGSVLRDASLPRKETHELHSRRLQGNHVGFGVTRSEIPGYPEQTSSLEQPWHASQSTSVRGSRVVLCFPNTDGWRVKREKKKENMKENHIPLKSQLRYGKAENMNWKKKKKAVCLSASRKSLRLWVQTQNCSRVTKPC